MAVPLPLVRILASFAPARIGRLGDWEPYVDFALANGLAPLAAYNLEYRLGGGNAPEWARDRLLSLYQGSLNDNVMKLVELKRAMSELEGRKVIALGGASFAEALYPHVAFRPVLEAQLLVPPAELAPLAGYLRAHGFKGNDRELSDGRLPLALVDQLTPDDAGLFERAIPFKAFGASIFRLDLEDALLTTCLEQARAGYELPLISFVDLRELVLGAPSLSGPYSRPVDAALVLATAARWRISRALYASLAILRELFPETADAVARLTPPLRPATRALLDRLVVKPVIDLGGDRRVRGGDRLRRLLTAR
jgi:hypothetical protein